MSLAAEILLRREGKRDSSAIVIKLCHLSPRRSTTIEKREESFLKRKTKWNFRRPNTSFDGRSKLSTRQYNVIRQPTNKIHKSMYPAYKIKVTKQLCYPSGVNTTENFSEIKLQSLMDHTITRLCKKQEELLKSTRDMRTREIIVKLGCDGADQNRYKRRFSSENCSDESLLVSI
ncbi:hypothetical protein AVEN_59502-1 [Araneus ventricosus]|uniref:Uncharacterized protein n=1 Tax=Araneus ventricosus TaxID=182803 RepID=A0A4Y2K1D4_ARAVE|nr:hypothetical protein AVEN_59502-1 [Araneus ventricosus]